MAGAVTVAVRRQTDVVGWGLALALIAPIAALSGLAFAARLGLVAGAVVVWLGTLVMLAGIWRTR